MGIYKTAVANTWGEIPFVWPPSPASDFSCAFWARPDTFETNYYMFGNQSVPNCYYVSSDSSNLASFFLTLNGVLRSEEISGTPIDDAWVFVGVEFESPNNQRVYHDTSVSSRTHPQPNGPGTIAPWFGGRNRDTGTPAGGFVAMGIAEIAFWKGALSSASWLALAGGTPANAIAESPFAYYPLTNMTDLADVHGGQADINLQGPEWSDIDHPPVSGGPPSGSNRTLIQKQNLLVPGLIGV